MLRYCATATPERESFRQSGLGRRQRQYDGARAHRLGSEAPSHLEVPTFLKNHSISLHISLLTPTVSVILLIFTTAQHNSHSIIQLQRPLYPPWCTSVCVSVHSLWVSFRFDWLFQTSVCGPLLGEQRGRVTLYAAYRCCLEATVVKIAIST